MNKPRDLKTRSTQLVESIKSGTPFSTDLANLVHDYASPYLSDEYNLKYDEERDQKMLALAKELTGKPPVVLQRDGITNLEAMAFAAIESYCVDTLCHLLRSGNVDAAKVYQYLQDDAFKITEKGRGTLQKETLLSVAISKLRLGIAQLLLEHFDAAKTINVRVNDSFDSYAETALSRAAILPCAISFIQLLLDYGADPGVLIRSQKKDFKLYGDSYVMPVSFEHTPLHAAIKLQKLAVTQLFLAHKKELLLVKTPSGESFLDHAFYLASKKLYVGAFDILKLLLRTFALLDSGDAVIKQAYNLRMYKPSVSEGGKPGYLLRNAVIDKKITDLLEQYFKFMPRLAEFSALWDSKTGTPFEKVIYCLEKTLQKPDFFEKKSALPFFDAPQSQQEMIEALKSNQEKLQDASALLAFMEKFKKGKADESLTQLMFFLECKLSECVLQQVHSLKNAPQADVKSTGP